MTGISDWQFLGGSSVGQSGHIAKWIYDPNSNHIVVGAMAPPESVAATHAQLLGRAGIARPGDVQFGHVHADGRGDMYSRSQMARGGKMNPYEAAHKAKRAVEHAIPGVSWLKEPFVPSHNRWDIHPPSVDYVEGQPPILEANGNASETPAEDDWEF